MNNGSEGLNFNFSMVNLEDMKILLKIFINLINNERFPPNESLA